VVAIRVIPWDRFMDQSQTDPRVGVVLEGRYQVTHRLAEGSMGVVYRAERVRLGRSVAIKFLRASFAGESQFLQRFEREARAMSRLGHPHCVSVIDFGVAGDGAPYVVMEYVTGTTLATLLERGRLPAARALGITRQVLAGLAHAHGQGIIHRDLKAANVMLTEATGTGDHARLLDFGLAKLLDHLPSDVSSSHLVIGTPSYMSPEQSLGEIVDARSDLYSAGVLLFELLTGDKPFRSEETHDLLRQHREAAPPTLAESCPGAEFPKALERLVARALAKDPDDRFQSAIDMAEALDAVPVEAGGARRRSPELAYAPTESFDAVKPRRSRRGPVLALILVLAGAGAVYAHQRGMLDAPSSEASPPVAPAEVATSEQLAPGPADPAHAASDATAPAELAPPPLPDEYPDWNLLASAAPDPEVAADAGVVTGPLAVIELGELDALDLEPLPADSIQMDEMVLADDDEAGEESLPAEERDEPVAAVPEEESEPTVEDAPAEDPAPPPRREVRTIADAKKLIAAGKREEAIRGLRKLQREIPKSAYIPYLLGNLYFEKKWWKDGILAYRDAIKNNRIYRKKAILNQNLIRALGSEKTKGKAIWTFEHYVGKSALPYLRKAAKSDKNPTVRRRASWLAGKLAKQRR
jgi:eukaryotic-like serine/threonine-protein kinase